MTELDRLINFWTKTLFHDQYLIPPATIVLIKSTLKHLKQLKTIKGG